MGMEVLCYYDTGKNRKREFLRFQVSRDGEQYVYQETLCKSFGEETACEEVDRQEFESEKEARTVYENRLRDL